MFEIEPINSKITDSKSIDKRLVFKLKTFNAFDNKSEPLYIQASTQRSNNQDI